MRAGGHFGVHGDQGLGRDGLQGTAERLGDGADRWLPGPVADAARELGRRLAAGGSAPTATVGTAPPGAPVLGQVVSQPVTELVRTALQNSDNVLAEAVRTDSVPSWLIAVNAEPGSSPP